MRPAPRPIMEWSGRAPAPPASDAGIGDGRTTHLGQTRPIDNVRNKVPVRARSPRICARHDRQKGNGRISLTSGPDALCGPGRIRLYNRGPGARGLAWRLVLAARRRFAATTGPYGVHADPDRAWRTLASD